jgi:hypothetical protein
MVEVRLSFHTKWIACVISVFRRTINAIMWRIRLNKWGLTFICRFYVTGKFRFSPSTNRRCVDSVAKHICWAATSFSPKLHWLGCISLCEQGISPRPRFLPLSLHSRWTLRMQWNGFHAWQQSREFKTTQTYLLLLWASSNRNTWSSVRDHGCERAQ